MTAPLALFVIDPDPHAAAQLRAALPDAGLRYGGQDASAEHALPGLMSGRPDVIVLDAGACADLPAMVRRLAVACPTSCVIVTGLGTPPAVMSRAVASGARGFLLKPYGPADLFSTVAEALEVSRAMADAAAPRAPQRTSGKLFAVYSPKGGVGCTTIATNLAVAIASRGNPKVALVDLDLQFGDIGAALDLHSVNSIAEILRSDEFGADLIEETFVRHESGVRALLAPEDLGLVDSIETGQVVSLLERLRDHFDYVVCDLWSSLDELTRGVMRIADRVIMVTTPEYPALRDLQRVLKSVRTELSLDDRLLIVLNRYPGKVGLDKDEIAKVLGRGVAATIPSEGITVTDAINRGLSLLDARARVRIANHYRDLAARTVAESSSPVTVSRPKASVQISP